MTELTKGVLGGLGSAVSWACISILARSLSGTLGPAAINAIRSTVGGILVLAVAVATGYGSEVVRMPLWAVLTLWLSITIGFALGDTVFFVGMESLGVTRAHTLSMAHPLLTTVVGMGLLGEPVTLWRVTGILLVLGGISLIIAGKGEDATDVPGGRWRGVRLVLLAAGTWSLSTVLLKGPLQVASAMAAAAVRSPVGGLVLWLTPWTRGAIRTVATSRPQDLVRLAAVCLLSAASALLFTTGVKYGGVAVGAVLSTTSPLFTIPLEVMVLGRRPSRRTVLGATVTVAGIGLMNL
jgi:drug/metabolite transporter (DMT)-like permease